LQGGIWFTVLVAGIGTDMSRAPGGGESYLDRDGCTRVPTREGGKEFKRGEKKSTEVIWMEQGKERRNAVFFGK